MARFYHSNHRIRDFDYYYDANRHSEVYRGIRGDSVPECLGILFLSHMHAYKLVAHIEADNLHLIFRELMGKYPDILTKVMTDDTPGQTKACLYLGCGNGR